MSAISQRLNAHHRPQAWLGDLLALNSDDPVNDYAQTYFNIYYIPLRTCFQQSSSTDSASQVNHIQIQRQPTGKLGLQATRAHYDQYGGNVETWIKSITSTSPQPIFQPCWHRVPNAPSPSCNGTCSFTQPIIALPVVLMIEFPLDSTEGGDWFIPDRITIARRNSSSPEAVVYELSSRAFFKRLSSHYALRFRLKSAKGNRYHIYDYDDMDQHAHGYAKRVSAGSTRAHMTGKHADISPPPGFTSTSAAVYVLANASAAQQAFSSQQSRALKEAYGISLSSSSIPDIPSTNISLQQSGFSRVPDSDRFWFKKARRKTAQFLDFSRLPIEPPPKVQSTVSVPSFATAHIS